MGSRRVGHDWAMALIWLFFWTINFSFLFLSILFKCSFNFGVSIVNRIYRIFLSTMTIYFNEPDLFKCIKSNHVAEYCWNFSSIYSLISILPLFLFLHFVLHSWCWFICYFCLLFSLNYYFPMLVWKLYTLSSILFLFFWFFKINLFILIGC